MEPKELIKRSIPRGMDNALTSNQLEKYTGFSERTVKEYIRQLRVDDNLPIVSSSDGGYFLPRPNSEVDREAAKRFVKMQEVQAKNRFLSAKSVKEFLEENRQQLSIEEII